MATIFALLAVWLRFWLRVRALASVRMRKQTVWGMLKSSRIVIGKTEKLTSEDILSVLNKAELNMNWVKTSIKRIVVLSNEWRTEYCVFDTGKEPLFQTQQWQDRPQNE